MAPNQPAEAADVTGASATAMPMAGGRELDLVVDPNQSGVNELHLYLLDATGRPVDAEQPQLRRSMPAEDIGPIVRTASPISPGHWIHVGRELAISGRWRIEAQPRSDGSSGQRRPSTSKSEADRVLVGTPQTCAATVTTTTINSIARYRGRTP